MIDAMLTLFSDATINNTMCSEKKHRLNVSFYISVENAQISIKFSANVLRKN